MLAEENATMKEDLERKLSQVMEYKNLVEEYAEKLDAEVAKSSHLKHMLNIASQSKSLFGFGKSKEESMQ